MIKINLMVGWYVFLIALSGWSIWVLIEVKILLPILFVSLSYSVAVMAGCFLWDALKLLVKKLIVSKQ